MTKEALTESITWAIVVLTIVTTILGIVLLRHSSYHYKDKGYRYCIQNTDEDRPLDTDCKKYLGIIQE